MAKNRKSASAPKKSSGAAKASKGGKGGASKFSVKLILLGIVALALLLDLGFSFVPHKSVPDSLKGFHNGVLAFRNTIVARSGLPVSRYDDSAEIPTGDEPLKVYFAPSPKIAKALDAFIASASRNVSVCAYDIDLPDVVDSLIAAHRRGVSVRVVTDTDNFKNEAIGRLLRAGIKVVQDGKPSIMHNKFVVVDWRKVWTGSWNLTENGTWRNDNNALIVESPALATCYQAKFEEYWSGKFGKDAPRTPAKPDVMEGDVPLLALFSPSDGVRRTLLKELAAAKRRVDVMAFSFTSKELADELAALVKRGVKVRLLCDASQAAGKFNLDEYLRKRGVEVKISPNKRGRMHHKVMIIDDARLVTGSYNFSNNAEMRNDENVLLLESKPLVSLFDDEFERCWSGAKGY